MSSVIIGVDEAGRGPAIGPLVVSSICIPAEDLPHLEGIGAKDSNCLLYTSPSPRDVEESRMPSSA